MEAGTMTVKVVHRKTGKAYYTTDVAKISVIMACNQPIFRIKRRYWRGEELVTENAAFHGEEYYIAEVYDEEEWTND